MAVGDASGAWGPDRLDAVSYLNFLPEVRGGRGWPKSCALNDCTLREGEQAAGANFPFEVKQELARELIDAGIRQMELGYPGRSPNDFRFALWVREAGLPVTTEVLAQVFLEDWREQIERCLDTGADWIVLMYPASDLRLRYVQRVDRREMLRRSVEAVRYAVSRGGRVRFSPTDTTRSDTGFLRDLYRAVVDAGAERVSVADTAGSATPEAFAYLVERVVAWTGKPVHIHCHNDFGLATANTLAGIRAGASIADVTLGGLGERAGNAPLEQVAAALHFLYGVSTGIDLGKLTQLVRKVFAHAHLEVPISAPLVGRDAFAHKLDAHVWGVLNHPAVYESIPPEAVGNQRRIPIGKYSGRAALSTRLRLLGYPESTLEQLSLEDLARAAEELATTVGRELTDTELLGLVNAAVGGGGAGGARPNAG